MEHYKSVKFLIDSGDNIVGKFIRLEGNGLLNGLSGSPVKSELYKIIGIKGDNSLIVKGYNQKNNRVLPYYRFDQACELYSQVEQKGMKRGY